MKKETTMRVFVAMVLATGFCFAGDMTDNDRDGLPDLWEANFGLSTNRATGIDGPFGDPDSDGLSNFAEYRAGYLALGANIYSNYTFAVQGLNPTNARSVKAAVLDSYIRPSGTNDCLRFIFTDGDFCDDFWEMTNGVTTTDKYDDIRDVNGYSGWEYCRRLFWPATNAVSVNVSYYGDAANGIDSTLRIWFYSSASMMGRPAFTHEETVDGNWQLTKTLKLPPAKAAALTAASVYLYAFLDLNGNGVWNTGEPSGIGIPYAGDFGFDKTAFAICLTDRARYGFRLELPATTQPYQRVRVRRISTDGLTAYAANVADISVPASKNWIDDAAWLGNGVYGLDWGLAGVPTGTPRLSAVYQVYVGNSTVYTNDLLVTAFTNHFVSARRTPAIVYPTGGVIANTRKPEFKWTISLPVANTLPSLFAIEILRSAVSVYAENAVPAPMQDNSGAYTFTAPIPFENGSYTWRVQAMDEKYSSATADTAWTGYSAFTIADRTYSPTNCGAIPVNLFYSGKTFSGTFVVAAYKNASFSGAPESFVNIAYAAAMTNMEAGVSCMLSLLGSGPHYVAAWRDANTDRIRDTDEPWGYLNRLGTPGEVAFSPKPVNVPVDGTPLPVNVIVEDIPAASRR